MNQGPSPRWVIDCRHCLQSFSHTEIGKTLTDYMLPIKPEIRPGGEEIECPNCKTKSVYTRSELRYQAR